MPTDRPRRRQIRIDRDVYSRAATVALLTACTALRRPIFAESGHAELALSELRRLHDDRWRVLGHCLMPDHVHFLVLNVDASMLEFMRLFKGRTARELRGRVEGRVWQRSFHDHLLRRHENISGTLRYLLENPVRAGLAREWTAYPWCGSLQWPQIVPEFFEAHPAEVLWAEVLDLDAISS